MDYNADDNNNKYFAAKKAKDCVEILIGKSQSWYNTVLSNGYLEKIKKTWAAYHGARYDGSISDGHQITFGGEQGELVEIKVNHLRNLGQIILTMMTSARPALQARSINSDYTSTVQTQLANGLLDYYLRDKRLENYLKNAVEYSIVLGAGYIKMDWNATGGEAYDFNDETQTEIKEGDVEFSNVSPLDVYFDLNKEDNNFDWIIVRSFKNKFDIAAKYPEFKDKIEDLSTVSDMHRSGLSLLSSNDSSDLIPIFEFYHKKSEALPEGRYMLYLDSDIVLQDLPMPYRRLPVYRISPANILGTPFGYTPLFDLLPIQDAIDMLHSTILTNQSTFGVQSLLVPAGSNIDVNQVAGGLHIIEADMRNGEIKPLNLTQTAPEIFNYLTMLEKEMETLSGISSVTRGTAPTNLKSGNALALLQSMTIQFMSGLQQSYVALMEDIGTGLINMLKDYASVPRIAEIVGKTNRSYMKEFTGGDLSSINRVIVDVGNPLSRTTAGRVEMAEQLLQMGLIKTPEQYISVMNTGNLETMTEDTQSELNTIRQENERFLTDEPVVTTYLDEHNLHIKEHRYVLSNPQLRFNPQLVEKVLSHIQEHVEHLRTVDPDLLMITNQQPLGPKGGSPANQQQNQPPDSSMGPAQNVVGNSPTQLQQQGVDDGSVPPPPKPPGEFANLPTDPAAMVPQQ